MVNVITLYDIPSTLPDQAWSPNVWKVRYALNIKRIPYETVWVEYPDIEPLAVRFSIKSTNRRPNGQPFYTLPIIHDPSTDVTLSDSLDIIAYLDRTYPGTPTLLPTGSHVFQAAFEPAMLAALGVAEYAIMLPATHKIINAASQEFFWRTKGMAQLNLEEDNWKKLEDGLGTVDGWLKRKEETQKYIAGDAISFADISLAARLLWPKKVFGEKSEEWQRISGWHGGRWGGLVEALKEFEYEDQPKRHGHCSCSHC
jgi:glutathione S-transferase